MDTTFIRRAASATVGAGLRPAAALAAPASPAVPAKAANPADVVTPSMLDYLVGQLAAYRKSVPLFLLSPGLQRTNLPVKRDAEVGRSVLSHILAEAELSPVDIISATMTGTGTLELSAPAGSNEVIVAALVLEFATTADNTAPGDITGSIKAAYSGAVKMLDTAGVHTLRARGAAYENYDYDSGVFSVRPTVLGTSLPMVLFPHQLVQERIFIRPLSLAEPMVRFVEASTIRLTLTGAPTGLLTTMSVLTVGHEAYAKVMDALSAP